MSNFGGGFDDHSKIKRKRQSYVPPNDIRRNNHSHLASPGTSMLGGLSMIRSPMMSPHLMSPTSGINNSRPSVSQLFNEELNHGNIQI